MVLKKIFGVLHIDPWWIWNFTSIEGTWKKYNSNVDLSKYAFNPKILKNIKLSKFTYNAIWIQPILYIFFIELLLLLWFFKQFDSKHVLIYANERFLVSFEQWKFVLKENTYIIITHYITNHLQTKITPIWIATLVIASL